MQYLRTLLFLSLVTISVQSTAVTQATDDLVIEDISLTLGTDKVYVKTNPLPAISALGCSSNYWVDIPISQTADDEYRTLISLLLSAKATSNKVYLELTDNEATPQFCFLHRIVVR